MFSRGSFYKKPHVQKKRKFHNHIHCYFTHLFAITYFFAIIYFFRQWLVDVNFEKISPQTTIYGSRGTISFRKRQSFRKMDIWICGHMHIYVYFYKFIYAYIHTYTYIQEAVIYTQRIHHFFALLPPLEMLYTLRIYLCNQHIVYNNFTL